MATVVTMSTAKCAAKPEKGRKEGRDGVPRVQNTVARRSATQFFSCELQQSLLSPAQLFSQQMCLSFFQLDFTLCIRHTCSILRPVIENKDDDINQHQQGPRPQGPFLIRTHQAEDSNYKFMQKYSSDKTKTVAAFI